jgi:hypothetical protein
MTDAAPIATEVEVARGFLVAAANLVSGLTFQVVIPLVSLLAMVVMFIWVLSRAQKSDDFDASQFLRDEFGKLSAWRLFAFVCVSTHTWVIFSQQFGLNSLRSRRAACRRLRACAPRLVPRCGRAQ